MLVICPLDNMVNWELWLSATTQHHKNFIWYIASLEKVQNSNSKCGFYWVCFATIKAKNVQVV
jgi:hypothetical protein